MDKHRNKQTNKYIFISSPIEFPKCSNGTIACKNHQCFEPSGDCDSHRDCIDFSDEECKSI